jgi:O-antigen/teichoic acid export membrane protein
MNIKKHFQTLMKPSERSLKTKSIRAATWSILGRGGSHIIRMAGNLILTRILFPEAFGMMATANMAFTMVNFFSDTGVKTAIIQNPNGAEPEYLNTAWIITLVRGIILSLLLFLLAVPISRFYNEHDLKGIMMIIACNPLILSFENPALTLFIKKFRIEKQVSFELGTQFLSLTCSVILAVLMRSVYALAIGMTLNSVFRVFWSYWTDPYRPHVLWNKKAGSELLHFGKYIFLNTMITWAVLNADILIVSKLLGMESTGLYNQGKNYAYLITTFCLQVTAQAYMPAVCSVINETPRVIAIYRRTTALFLAVAIPFSLIFVFFSNDIIRILYDSRYLNASISMSWLSLAGILQLISIITGTTFIALGKPVTETISVTICLLVGTFFILFGIRLGGLTGASIGMASMISLTAIIESMFLFKTTGFPLKIVLRPWGQAAITVFLSGIFFYLLKPLFRHEFFFNIPFMLTMLIIGTGISAGIYVLLEGTHPFQDRNKV